MEMTESFRQPAPELSKSDFFNFVTSNEITDAQYKEQMRSVNVFMESPDSRSNPLLSEEPKEQNNNILLSSASSVSSGGISTTTTTLQSFDSIWNADRDRGRLEDVMLEDLNYWTQESDINGSQPCGISASSSNKLISNNTDGQIYTLTVQDVSDPNSRYWCKEEDVSMSSPNEMEQIQSSSLDLESILNIMPHQMNGFTNDFSQDGLSTVIPKVETFNYEEGESESHNNDLSSGSLVKVEQYNYDDGDFSSSDIKSELHSPVTITPLLEGQVEFNNNNNDWKLTDQNTESNESLLRSALQGKAFIRYSTIQKNSGAKIDSSELKRVIINHNNNKADMPSMYAKDVNGEQQQQLVMTLAPQNGVNIVLFEDPTMTATVIPDCENPTSTQSVDDILLSQLDATYPDDFEKLKRIANELGESVQQYCTVDPTNVYNIHHLNGELVTMIPASDVQIPQTHLQIVTASPTVSSTKTVAKKYKRQKSSSPGSQMQAASSIGSPSIQTATSTSNGIRKERSLHYCSICSKGFKDKYSVNVHVRTHTGEKPFSCSLCGKSFRQKAHLAKHYQTHIAQKTASANGAVKTNKQR